MTTLAPRTAPRTAPRHALITLSAALGKHGVHYTPSVFCGHAQCARRRPECTLERDVARIASASTARYATR